MKILSFTWNLKNSSAVLLKENEIICSQEERFNRIKNTSKPPINAINYSLYKGKTQIKNVDFITTNLKNYNLLPSKIKDYSNKIINVCDHHFAHAASAFRVSGMENSNIIVADGKGDFESLSAYNAEKYNIQNMWKIPANKCSAGEIYLQTTYHLGFKRFQEGKTMGLAPYGTPAPQLFPQKFMNFKTHNDFLFFDKSEGRLPENFFPNKIRSSTEPITNVHKQIAATLQSDLEESMINIVNELVDTTGNKNLCLAGGVFLNCKLNGEIMKKCDVKNIFIQPNATDSGISLGYALEIAYNKFNFTYPKINHTSFGPEFNNELILNILNKYSSKIKFEHNEDITGKVSELLYKDKVIGWFQGKMEWGPRALGNRSILANPSSKKIANRVNKIKSREMWRPFGPSILVEKQKKWFENSVESPFMLMCFDVLDNKKEEIEAIVHVDGTTRPQSVIQKENPLFHKLISQFEKESGIPMLLNTSFNTKGEPIVCCPQDALNSFMNMKLDYLAMGDYIITRK